MKTNIHAATIVRIIGKLVLIEGLLMLAPLLVCVIYGESDWKGFSIAVASACAAGGLLMLATRKAKSTIRAREGYIVTSVIWMIFGIFGMIPLMLGHNEPMNFTDSMFEIISGFTTTGASVYRDVDVLSHGILFWRAFSQWIGGLGIILFMLALLPELNKAVGISMFNAEASGMTNERLHPRIRQTALSLWSVYAGITAVSILLLWAGPVNLFDSTCQTFAAIASGGFATHAEGIMYWHSDYVMVVLIMVMFMSGLNFMVIYEGLRGNMKTVRRNRIIRTLVMVIIVASVTIALSISACGGAADIKRLVIDPLFHVVSAITTTGFSVEGYESWGQYTLFVTVILMLIGSCAGSTSGGIKIDRIVALWNNLCNELRKTVFPKRVYAVSLNGSYLESGQITRISAFVAIYLLVLFFSTGVATLYGYSLQDSLFMMASSIGNNGLGYGATGASGSFALLPDVLKWIMIFNMLIGRLELFTFLVLFLPSFWRR